jgi:DNA ligase-1
MTLLWKPLLSGTLPLDPATGDFRYDLIPFPVYASPKLDGFRSEVQRGVLLSRNGLPVKNHELQARYGRKEYEGLDVELTDGPANGVDVFHRTSSVAKKASASAVNVRMNVIDFVPDIKKGNGIIGHTASRDDLRIEDRQYFLRDAAVNWLPTHIHVIKQTLIRTVAQLKVYEAKILKQGYEGVMLRRVDQGAYPQKPGKQNRSTLNEFYLVRMKRFEQAEAVIIAVHPLKHNANEERTATGARSSKKAGIVVDATKIGSATLKDCKTGKLFDTNIGAARLRKWKGWPSAIGKKVRYKYQLVGTKDLPRINSCTFDELEVLK